MNSNLNQNYIGYSQPKPLINQAPAPSQPKTDFNKMFTQLYQNYFWHGVVLAIIVVVYCYNKKTRQVVYVPPMEPQHLVDNEDMAFHPIQTKVQPFEPYYDEAYTYPNDTQPSYYEDTSNYYTFNHPSETISGHNIHGSGSGGEDSSDSTRHIDSVHNNNLPVQKFDFGRPKRDLQPTVIPN